MWQSNQFTSNWSLGRLSVAVSKFVGSLRPRQRLTPLGVAALLGVGGSLCLSPVALAQPAPQANTGRVNIWLDRQPGESYDGLLRRAEAAARGATLNRFNQNGSARAVAVTVLAQSEGSVAPILSLQVNRQNWSRRPEVQRWATYFPNSRSLLRLDGTGTTTTAQTPTVVTPVQVLPNGTVVPVAVPGQRVQPNGAVVPGTVPGQVQPNGTVVPGSVPGQVLPNGAVVPGSVPGQVLPNGAVVPGSVPGQVLPNGAVAPGTVPGQPVILNGTPGTTGTTGTTGINGTTGFPGTTGTTGTTGINGTTGFPGTTGTTGTTGINGTTGFPGTTGTTGTTGINGTTGFPGTTGTTR